MKDTIRTVLARWRDRQPNMSSEEFRNNLADEIAIVLAERGTYTEYGDDEIEEQKARESWVCSICGESTYEVEYDYIGSGANHLGCELEIELAEKRLKEANVNPDHYIAGSITGGSAEFDGAYTPDEFEGWEEAVKAVKALEG